MSPQEQLFDIWMVIDPSRMYKQMILLHWHRGYSRKLADEHVHFLNEYMRLDWCKFEVQPRNFIPVSGIRNSPPIASPDGPEQQPTPEPEIDDDLVLEVFEGDMTQLQPTMDLIQQVLYQPGNFLSPAEIRDAIINDGYATRFQVIPRSLPLPVPSDDPDIMEADGRFKEPDYEQDSIQDMVDFTVLTNEYERARLRRLAQEHGHDLGEISPEEF